MNIKLELLQNHISDCVREAFKMNVIDVDEIADSNAINIIDKIKSVICDSNLSDFEAIEQIIYILEENNINCGSRHDY